jgi:hypothetical protein
MKRTIGVLLSGSALTLIAIVMSVGMAAGKPPARIPKITVNYIGQGTTTEDRDLVVTNSCGDGMNTFTSTTTQNAETDFHFDARWTFKARWPTVPGAVHGTSIVGGNSSNTVDSNTTACPNNPAPPAQHTTCGPHKNLDMNVSDVTLTESKLQAGTDSGFTNKNNCYGWEDKWASGLVSLSSMIRQTSTPPLTDDRFVHTRTFRIAHVQGPDEQDCAIPSGLEPPGTVTNTCTEKQTVSDLKVKITVVWAKQS